MGVLPLGTGNAWAHALGAPKLHACLERSAHDPRRSADPPLRSGRRRGHPRPLRRVGLGRDDPRRLPPPGRGEPRPGPARSRRASTATSRPRCSARCPRWPSSATRASSSRTSATRSSSSTRAASRSKLEGVGRGTVLYDAPAGIASVGTCPEFGYRFKAFPFAERMPGLHQRARLQPERPRRGRRRSRGSGGASTPCPGCTTGSPRTCA